MKCFSWLVPILVFVLIVAGCSEDPTGEKTDDAPTTSVELPSEPEFHSILPKEAFSLLERGGNILVVDVREPAEREERIAGSIAVSLDDIMRGEIVLPRDRQLLLVCSVGGRSYAAGLYLLKERYPLVYNLRGGVSAWRQAGLPLEHGTQ